MEKITKPKDNQEVTNIVDGLDKYQSIGGVDVPIVRLANSLYRSRKPLEYVYNLLTEVELLDRGNISLEDLYYIIKEYRLILKSNIGDNVDER